MNGKRKWKKTNKINEIYLKKKMKFKFNFIQIFN